MNELDLLEIAKRQPDTINGFVNSLFINGLILNILIESLKNDKIEGIGK